MGTQGRFGYPAKMANPAQTIRSFVDRQTTSGNVRGRSEGGIATFLGIPYAAPPTRFVAPQPVVPWAGVRDATQCGDCAPHEIKAFPGLDIVPLVGNGGLAGRDYLTLNIWAPEGAQACPVMVFVHGGGFVGGSKDAAVSTLR